MEHYHGKRIKERKRINVHFSHRGQVWRTKHEQLWLHRGTTFNTQYVFCECSSWSGTQPETILRLIAPLQCYALVLPFSKIWPIFNSVCASQKHLRITNGWRPAQLNKALSGNRVTLSLVNISASLNNADCHLLFILLLSLWPSLLSLTICFHSLWIASASYVSIFPSSHHLQPHLHSSFLALTFSTSLIWCLKYHLFFFLALHLPAQRLGDRDNVRDDSDGEGV